MKTKYIGSSRKFGAKEASKIASVLVKIQTQQGVITPPGVVRYAEKPSSPLHKYFTWDDSLAAQKYRESQAAELIRCVYVVDADNPKSTPVRAFVNLKPDADDEFIPSQGYVATETISGKQNYEAQVLQYAHGQLVLWKKKFGSYKEFFEVAKAIESIKI